LVQIVEVIVNRFYPLNLSTDTIVNTNNERRTEYVFDFDDI